MARFRSRSRRRSYVGKRGRGATRNGRMRRKLRSYSVSRGGIRL